MFRVRFNMGHTDGYGPAQDVDKVIAKLGALLKRQRLEASHIDEAGFTCYVPVTSKPKHRRLAKPCNNCGHQPA